MILVVTLRVKLLVVLSQGAFSDRGNTTVFETVGSFAKDLDQCQSSIAWAFTKFSDADDEADEIRAALRDKLDVLTETLPAQSPVLQLFADAVTKTKHRVHVVCPLSAKAEYHRQNLIEELHRLLPISRPAEAFQGFTSPQSLRLVEQQLEKHRTAVAAALARDEPELVSYKLLQLSLLVSHVGMQHQQKLLDTCLQNVVDAIHKRIFSSI